MINGLDLLLAAANTHNPQQTQSALPPATDINLTIQSLQQTIFSAASRLCSAFDSYRNLLVEKISTAPERETQEGICKLQPIVIQAIALQILQLSMIAPGNQTPFQAPAQEDFETIANQWHQAHIKEFEHTALNRLSIFTDSQYTVQARNQACNQFTRLLQHIENCTNFWIQCQEALKTYFQEQSTESSSSSSSSSASQSSSSTNRGYPSPAYLGQNPSSSRGPIPKVMGTVVHCRPRTQSSLPTQNPRYLTVPLHNPLAPKQLSPIKTRKRSETILPEEPPAAKRRKIDENSYSGFSDPVTTVKIPSSSSSSLNQSLLTQEIRRDWSGIDFKTNPQPLKNCLKLLTPARLQKCSIEDLTTILSSVNSASNQLDTQLLVSKCDATTLKNTNNKQTKIVTILKQLKKKKLMVDEVDKLRKRMNSILSAGDLTRKAIVARRIYQDMQLRQLLALLTRT